jgi:hypothetical protein
VCAEGAPIFLASSLSQTEATPSSALSSHCHRKSSLLLSRHGALCEANPSSALSSHCHPQSSASSLSPTPLPARLSQLTHAPKDGPAAGQEALERQCLAAEARKDGVCARDERRAHEAVRQHAAHGGVALQRIRGRHLLLAVPPALPVGLGRGGGRVAEREARVSGDVRAARKGTHDMKPRALLAADGRSARCGQRAGGPDE